MSEPLHPPTYEAALELIQKLEKRNATLEKWMKELKQEQIDLINENAELFTTSVTISKRNRTWLKKFGNGNMSRGIRLLVAEYQSLWEGKR